MREIVFITSEDARYGFSLAGSTQVTVAAEKTEQLLQQTMAESRVGVIVIDERLTREISAQRFTELEANWRGLLVTLPAPKSAGDGGEDDLQRLIRRALGYHVRLQP